MSQSTFNQGQKDAEQNRGQPPRSAFGSNRDHQDYLRGRNGK